MKIQQVFLIGLLGIFLSCAGTKQTANVAPVVDDGKISFTFLQLNDVYEISPLEGGKVGGMARVSNLRNKLLTENPNTLTFLAGDFLNPSLLATIKYNGERIKGKQMVEVMNAMGIDLVAFGNHEFDLSKNELQQRLNESEFDWITANARLKVCGDTFPFYKERLGEKEFVKDTHIFTLKDSDGTSLKIGFFSVIIPSNPQSYVAYTDIFEKAETTYNALKENVDIVFGLTHVAIDQDKKIASLLPDVPLIMGGHEHNNMLVSVGNTKISKADANAKTVYVHHLLYDRQLKTLKIDSQLTPITPETGEDSKVQEIVTKWNNILDKEIREVVTDPYEVIYHADVPLDGRDSPIRSIQTNLGQIVASAMSYAFEDDVDCALVNGGSIRIDDQLQGDINSIDVFRVLPFGGGVLKVELKGNLLKKVLDYGESKAGKGAYLQRYNVAQKDGEWLVGGHTIEDEKIYRVAFSDYLLKGLDIPFLTPENKEVLTVSTPEKEALAYDIRKAVIQYLRTLK